MASALKEGEQYLTLFLPFMAEERTALAALCLLPRQFGGKRHAGGLTAISTVGAGEQPVDVNDFNFVSFPEAGLYLLTILPCGVDEILDPLENLHRLSPVPEPGDRDAVG